jgi:hypothetical protein
MSDIDDDYAAYRDQNHPRHATVVEFVDEMMEAEMKAANSGDQDDRFITEQKVRNFMMDKGISPVRAHELVKAIIDGECKQIQINYSDDNSNRKDK